MHQQLQRLIQRIYLYLIYLSWSHTTIYILIIEKYAIKKSDKLQFHCIIKKMSRE